MTCTDALYKATDCLTSREGEVGAEKERGGEVSVLMVGPSASVSKDCKHVLVMRQALRNAESIMMRKGGWKKRRGMLLVMTAHITLLTDLKGILAGSCV